MRCGIVGMYCTVLYVEKSLPTTWFVLCSCPMSLLTIVELTGWWDGHVQGCDVWCNAMRCDAMRCDANPIRSDTIQDIHRHGGGKAGEARC